MDKRHSPISAVGRETIAARVRQALNFEFERGANNVVNVVTDSIVAELKANIDANGFILELPSFGKVEVRHREGKIRKIPLTGKVLMTANGK